MYVERISESISLEIFHFFSIKSNDISNNFEIRNAKVIFLESFFVAGNNINFKLKIIRVVQETISLLIAKGQPSNSSFCLYF